MQSKSIIQNYRLLSKIGEGGMGEVWHAQHLFTDREVALKILHAQYARNANLRARFRNEAITLSKLQHPNIVALYDFIETNEEVCLAMEYVRGRNLDDVIRKEMGPIPGPQLGSIFKQILLAMAHAHNMGVVHRDIKPSNFMLTDDGKVKVLDFGIAKVLDDDLQLTRTGVRMGTSYYMSPEQVNGSNIDHRSDIYALGVTLFTLATGKNPYDGEQVEFKIYHRIVHEPLPKASSLYPGVSSNIDWLISKATAKDPDQRFQRCEDFLVGKGLDLAPPSPPQVQAAMPPALPLDAAFKKRFRAQRRFAWVCAIGGFLLSPVFGGMSGLWGGIVSVGIAAGAIGYLQRNNWAKALFPSMLGVHIALCVLVGTGTLRNVTNFETVGTGFEFRMYESHYVTFTGDTYLWLMSMIFAVVGLLILYTRNGRKYWDN